jgi:hypothetical protein
MSNARVLSTYPVANLVFKNRLINAQGLINQRSVSGTVTLAAGAYGHDRFKAGASGCTYTFSTSGNVTTFTITAGSLIQVVEGLNLETGTYCLSWTGTAQGKIGAGSYSASGVTGSITGGTDTNVEFNTGTLSLPQLEKGLLATSFDYRSYGAELTSCERYGRIVSFGTIGRATAVDIIAFFASFEPMRAAPVASLISGSVIADNGSASVTSASPAVNAQAMAVNGGRIFISGFSGLTVGATWPLSSGNRIFLSAEL